MPVGTVVLHALAYVLVTNGYLLLVMIAVALGVLGAVSLIAAAVLKLAKRSPAVAERPRPAAPPATARTRTPSSTTTRGAHVFGVDVPPSRDSEAG